MAFYHTLYVSLSLFFSCSIWFGLRFSMVSKLCALGLLKGERSKASSSSINVKLRFPSSSLQFLFTHPQLGSLFLHISPPPPIFSVHFHYFLMTYSLRISNKCQWNHYWAVSLDHAPLDSMLAGLWLEYVLVIFYTAKVSNLKVRLWFRNIYNDH